MMLACIQEKISTYEVIFPDCQKLVFLLSKTVVFFSFLGTVVWKSWTVRETSRLFVIILPGLNSRYLSTPGMMTLKAARAHKEGIGLPSKLSFSLVYWFFCGGRGGGITGKIAALPQLCSHSKASPSGTLPPDLVGIGWLCHWKGITFLCPSVYCKSSTTVRFATHLSTKTGSNIMLKHARKHLVCLPWVKRIFSLSSNNLAFIYAVVGIGHSEPVQKKCSLI